jgi:uncharacterized membrane protein YbhN (UPF0104 family)
MASKILLNSLKNIAFLLIGLALLYLAFRGSDLKQLVADLKEANYFYVSLSLAFGLIAYYSRGARWLIILEPMGYKAKLSNSVYSIIIGYFANLAIPRIGELTRCTIMNQAEDIPVDKLFGTVIMERIIDLILLLSLTLLTVLLKVDQFGGFFLDLINANKDKYPAVMSALIVLIGLGLVGIVLLYLMKSRLSHFPLAIKIRTFFLGIKEGLVSVRKIKNLRGFYFHTFLIWICYYFMTWVVFYSIEATSSLTMVDGLFILVVGGFGMAAPVQGGIGAYHFIVSLGLAVLGIANGPALSYATIVHTSQTLLVLLAGSISFGLIYLNNRKNKTSPSTT